MKLLIRSCRISLRREPQARGEPCGAVRWTHRATRFTTYTR